MKKVSFRSILLTFLIAASLSSYLFLQSVEVPESEIQASEIHKSDNEEAVFPEIELVKKVLKIGRTIVPVIPRK